MQFHINFESYQIIHENREKADNRAEPDSQFDRRGGGSNIGRRYQVGF